MIEGRLHKAILHYRLQVKSVTKIRYGGPEKGLVTFGERNQ